jgi:hypothetical protein
MLKFKVVAILKESLIWFCFRIYLFIKPNNFDLYKTLLYPIGMSHGVLFIGYVILALY